MNKKLFGLSGLILGLILSILVYFLIKKPKNSTISLKDIDFAVKDTASIYQVILTGYIEGNPVGKVYLNKKNNQWWVNNQFKAQNVTVENLLNAIYSIQMQQVLHPNAIDNVKKLIKKRNIHVIIKNQNEKTLKGYYIGPATPDNKGNYIILEGSENPYIAEIPGFSGYFSARFSANPDAWRDYTIWKINPSDFQSFELKNKNHKTLIQVQKKNEVYFVNLIAFKDSNTIKNIEKRYLQCIATGLAKTTFPNAKDSLSKIPADFHLQVNHQNYLLWKNPYGAFFIVSTKKENQKVEFSDEIFLLPKITIQNWLFKPNE